MIYPYGLNMFPGTRSVRPVVVVYTVCFLVPIIFLAVKADPLSL